MRIEDLIDTLETEYPNDINTIETHEDLIKAKAQQELIAHIILIATDPKQKKGLGNG